MVGMKNKTPYKCDGINGFVWREGRFWILKSLSGNLKQILRFEMEKNEFFKYAKCT